MTGTTGVTGNGVGFSGQVLGGNVPLVAGSVQLYAAGTAGNGSAPTALLSTPLTTDAAGNFSIVAGSYSCPATNSLLYLVATGGQIGTNPANGAITLLTVPGVCANVASGASFIVNELTTAASVYVMRPFLAPGAQLGASATNAGGLGLGAATLANLVNLSAGSAPGAGFPANGVAPLAKLAMMADLLHTCVVSTGSGSTACASLFKATATGSTLPENTLDAMLSVANQPGNNVNTLYTLSKTAPAFNPTLSSPPPDWTLTIPFTGGGLSTPSTVALDAAGNVWVANYGNAASLFNNTGTPAYPAGITGYGLQQSYGGAVDANGVFWVANTTSGSGVNGGEGSITLLNTTGPALPGNSDFTAGPLYQPVSLAIDQTGTAWIVNSYNHSLVLLNNAGIPESGASGYTSNQLAFPAAIAVDSQRNGWVTNPTSDTGTVTQFNATGSSFTSYTIDGVPGSAPTGLSIDASDTVWVTDFTEDRVGVISAGKILSGNGYTGGGLNQPNAIATDGNGTAWITNYRGPGITQLAGTSAPAPGAAVSPTTGWAPDVNLQEAYSIAIDAAGNVWVTSSVDNRLIEYVGMAAPVKTPLLGATRIP